MSGWRYPATSTVVSGAICLISMFLVQYFTTLITNNGAALLVPLRASKSGPRSGLKTCIPRFFRLISLGNPFRAVTNVFSKEKIGQKKYGYCRFALASGRSGQGIATPETFLRASSRGAA